MQNRKITSTKNVKTQLLQNNTYFIKKIALSQFQITKIDQLIIGINKNRQNKLKKVFLQAKYTGYKKYKMHIQRKKIRWGIY